MTVEQSPCWTRWSLPSFWPAAWRPQQIFIAILRERKGSIAKYGSQKPLEVSARNYARRMLMVRCCFDSCREARVQWQKAVDEQIKRMVGATADAIHDNGTPIAQPRARLAR